MRWLGVLKVALVLASGFVVLGHAPGAWACSCVGYSNERDATDAAYANSSLVFVGTARSSHDTKAGAGVYSSLDPIAWTFDTESIQKGRASDPQVVSTARDGASCGYEFTVGKRYQVFAYTSGTGYSTGSCSGVRDLGAGELGTKPDTGSLRFSPLMPIALLGAAAVMLALAWRFRPRAS